MRHTFLRGGLDLRAKKPLPSFIQVEENEWKAFLEELSQLEKKYKLLFNMLDMDESRLQGLAAPEKKEVEREEASGQVSMKSSEKRQAGEVKVGFLSQLKTKLEHARPGILSRPQTYATYASCSRCGFQIVQPTRFCQRCGAAFGKMLCSCGRELDEGDKFCDRCGRVLRG